MIKHFYYLPPVLYDKHLVKLKVNKYQKIFFSFFFRFLEKMNIGSGTRVSDWTTMVVDSSCNQMDYMIKHFYYFLPGLSTKHLVI